MDTGADEETALPVQGAARKSGGVPQSFGACGVAAVSVVSSFPTGTAECLLCSEVTDLATFEPCGHQVVCEECCTRMKKCVSCQQAIHRKLNRNGHPINANGRTSGGGSGSSSGMNTSAERLRYLENKFAEIEEAYCCSICMERRRNIAFLCGHGACERCADALLTCHMCRMPISQKINLY